MDEVLRPAAAERSRSWEAAPAGFVDAELSDMANLTEEDTGVANRAALTEFWTDGHAWSRREVEAFIDGLDKLA